MVLMDHAVIRPCQDGHTAPACIIFIKQHGLSCFIPNIYHKAPASSECDYNSTIWNVMLAGSI